MTKLLLSQATQSQFERFCARPNHALMIVGEVGAGKLTLAREIACSLLNVKPSQLENQAFYREFTPSGASQSVTIESIRDLKQFLYLKTTGNAKIRRVILIQDAHTMTIEAQNALLKILEEPPADTVLLLTIATTLTLKPTIMSRAQQLRLLPPTAEQVLDFFTQQGFNRSKIEKAFLLSDGQAGLLTALLNEDSEHPLVSGIAQAKQLLSASRFERMAAIDVLSKQKDFIPVLLSCFRRIAKAALHQAAAANKHELVKRWQTTLSAVYDAERQLVHNPNSKLLLSDFLLNL